MDSGIEVNFPHHKYPKNPLGPITRELINAGIASEGGIYQNHPKRLSSL
jgi:hypothetical protein